MANTINLVWVPSQNYDRTSVSVPDSTKFIKRVTPTGWNWDLQTQTARPTRLQIWPRGQTLEQILSTLSDLTDVDLGTLGNNESLIYDSGTGKWFNRGGSIRNYGGTATFSGPGGTFDFTITEVDTSRAYVVITLGAPDGYTMGFSGTGLANSTTVRFTQTAGGANSYSVNFLVIETP